MKLRMCFNVLGVLQGGLYVVVKASVLKAHRCLRSC